MTDFSAVDYSQLCFFCSELLRIGFAIFTNTRPYNAQQFFTGVKKMIFR